MGAVTAGAGELGGAAGEALFGAAGKLGTSEFGEFAVKASVVGAGGFGSSVGGQAMGMALQGKSASEIRGQLGSTESLIGDAVSAGLGILGTGAAKGVTKFMKARWGALMEPEEELQPASRMTFFRNIVRANSTVREVPGSFGGLMEDVSPTEGQTGWTVWMPGVAQRIPKLVTPLAFNSKKFVLDGQGQMRW